MKTATGALPMNQPAGKKDGSAPAPGTNASDEPPMGTAGDYLKAIHEGIGHVKEYMVKMHEKVDGLHTKVDGLKPKDDTSNPPPKDDAVTQTPSGTDGKPEPVKALETRLTKLEASLEKLAGAVTVLVEKGLPTQQPKPGHF